EAGNPNWLAAPRNVSSASAALTVVNATDATNRREWSSTKFRISTLAPSARCHPVASACQRSLGRLASKRTKEERGRLCGCGVIKPRRRRMRQMGGREGGDGAKRPAGGGGVVGGPASCPA